MLHSEGRSNHEVEVGVVVDGGRDAGVVVDPLLTTHAAVGPAWCHGQPAHELQGGTTGLYRDRRQDVAHEMEGN